MDLSSIPSGGKLYNEGVIAIVFALPKYHNLDRACEISNVVISDLTTGQVIATLDKVEMGQENKVILSKLDDIQKDIKRNTSFLSRLYSYVVRIYYNIIKRR